MATFVGISTVTIPRLAAAEMNGASGSCRYIFATVQ
jgi:hypothetical protein